MRVLLIGHPVGHSFSPLMQNAAFEALELPHLYVAQDTSAADLAGTLRGLRDGRHLGANVTVPYKLAVVPVVDAVDADVRAIGALNTIVATGGRLSGYNTDVDGAWEGLLQPVRDPIRRSRVLVLGAGGGARAVLLALTRFGEEAPRDVAIAARRSEAADATAQLGVDLGLPCRAVNWWELAEAMRTTDVVVNCTPLGLGDEDPLERLPLAGRVVLDLAYRRGGTRLFQRAWSEAAIALQGDAMLLHQGAAAFQLWTGQEAPLEAMRRALAEALG
ncbi:MAG TPA: shikimate dehydrogenase [Candidatus Dormibacteraeota bacterium]|nr:shikimate dehydrogenase [Candidatus Dormibacteraeota bacterium]